MRYREEQPCISCGIRYSTKAFYYKGNVLMHCGVCREELREIKQQEMKRLLALEQTLS
ncbi:hypothetical protein ACQUWN_12715 [Rossellomorea aquimaris]|uniref:hypothetical protein n=1 Tax=Bacillaceae TaxID=186817 RepID=UPI0013B05CED|nr:MULTISPECIES: hypothetical protein [Bacillaceae]